jgi:hypothetical protein
MKEKKMDAILAMDAIISSPSYDFSGQMDDENLR